MEIPDFSLWSAARLRGRTVIMYQKGPFLILFPIRLEHKSPLWVFSSLDFSLLH
jgi:hypothetical protein